MNFESNVAVVVSTHTHITPLGPASFIAARSLICRWVATGDERRPLACVWLKSGHQSACYFSSPDRQLFRGCNRTVELQESAEVMA